MYTVLYEIYKYYSKKGGKIPVGNPIFFPYTDLRNENKTGGCTLYEI